VGLKGWGLTFFSSPLSFFFLSTSYCWVTKYYALMLSDKSAGCGIGRLWKVTMLMKNSNGRAGFGQVMLGLCRV